ncbi:MAG: glycosyltransferase, partial [Candidatus Hydrogenedentes bacterium]|nr:glycosyltransferase [Candidatus Hydrogenedentota bacterium]
LGVGRLVEKKVFVYLVDACELLRKRGVPFRCRIVGEGPGGAGLRQRIEALGLGDRVEIQRFCPHDRMAVHYAGSDVLVVPSIVAGDGDRDGVPNVILEAMAGGLPVVATGAGGIGEVVIDGLTGVLVGQRDVAAIAGAVLRLHEDVQLREQLAASARRFVAREFEPARWLDKLWQLFAQV